MPMDDEAKSVEIIKSAHATLERIAKTLNCSVEDFTDTEGSTLTSHDLAELIAIWGELQSGRDRNQLLAFARELVTR